MEQSNTVEEGVEHVCTTSKERMMWGILVLFTLVLGILIGMFLIPNYSGINKEVGASPQSQQQQATSTPFVNGQVVSISNTPTGSGAIKLRVSFDSSGSPTFQNPLPLSGARNSPKANTFVPTVKGVKGIKIVTVSFTKDTVFPTKKLSDIKAGDYLSIRYGNKDNASFPNNIKASQVIYFNPIIQIGRLVTSSGYALFGKVTNIKTAGSSKTITVSARIINKKEFVTVLESKVASRPYPHSLLRSDLSYINKVYTVTISSNTHVNDVSPSVKLAVGATVAISGKENIYTTDKITAVSLAVLPATPSSAK